MGRCFEKVTRLRILLATSSVAIAAALAFPAVAQEAPAAAPPAAAPADQGSQTPPVVDQADAVSDENQIVVVAHA
jgi:hypothetical protein